MRLAQHENLLFVDPRLGRGVIQYRLHILCLHPSIAFDIAAGVNVIALRFGKPLAHWHHNGIAPLQKEPGSQCGSVAALI